MYISIVSDLPIKTESSLTLQTSRLRFPVSLMSIVEVRYAIIDKMRLPRIATKRIHSAKIVY